MAQFFILLALDLGGLVLLWFLLRARIRRFLELENLLSGVREESRALVMELNETADRNVSILEDRIAAIRGLLDEVDRRMGLARRELESRESEREVFEKLRRRRPIVPAQDEDEVPIPLELRASDSRPEALVEGASPVESRLRASAPVAAKATEPREGEAPRRIPEISLAAEAVTPVRSRREEAYDLYRKGFSADIIAARLGATVAEIELLVDIEERRSETGLGG
jgi:hypothetical protein